MKQLLYMVKLPVGCEVVMAIAIAMDDFYCSVHILPFSGRVKRVIAKLCGDLGMKFSKWRVWGHHRRPCAGALPISDHPAGTIGLRLK